MSAARPPFTISFCVTCVARDRVIEHGRCIVCGQLPDEQAANR